MCRADKVVGRLVVAAHQHNIYTCAVGNFVHGLRTVDSISKRGGREGGDLRNAEVVQEVSILADNLDNFVNALPLHHAVAHIGGKSDSVFPLHEHFNAVAVNVIDSHANGIRAYVNHRVKHIAHPPTID